MCIAPKISKALFLVFSFVCIYGCTSPRSSKDLIAHYPYTNSLYSVGAQFGALPPVVQRSIRAQAGAANLQKITPLRVSGADVFEVTFSYWALPPLYVASDGSVLNPDFTVAANVSQTPYAVHNGRQAASLGITDLPEPTRYQLLKLAPSKPISSINRELWGNREVYIVNFAEEANTPSVYITADGTVLTAPSSALP